MARAVSLLSKATPVFPRLPPATGELPESGGVIVSSPAPLTRKSIEHAGHLYQERLIRVYGINTQSDDVENQQQHESSGPVVSKSNDAPEPLQAEDAASKLRSKLAVGSDDLYELLELGDKRWHATADEIKKSFRRISLIYHPDKISHLGEEARTNSEAHFKAVMKAYDVLSDKKKRAAYDSIDDVDDSLPSERDATASSTRFYDKFGACFALNARWSVSDRVPELGEDDKDIEEVHKFYDFWYSFKSWRDFSFDLEYDTDTAECREEKRWMERQNAKHVKARKNEESARIRRLVDLAFKHDPRLVRERAAVRAKKNAEKMQKKKAAEDAARVEREQKELAKAEEERKAAEEKAKRTAAKKQKDAQRQLMRKSRQSLRAVGRDLGIVDSERGLVALESMCSEGNVQSINAVCKLLENLTGEEGAADRGMDVLQSALKSPQTPLASENGAPSNGLEKNNANGQATETQPNMNGKSNGVASKTESGSGPVKPTTTEAKTKKQNQVVWTPEELSLLSKGVTKFPGGTRDRWNRLAEYIGTKTADEILKKVDESRPSKLRPGTASKIAASQAKPEEDRAFERFQEKKKGKSTAPPAAARAPTSSQPPNKFCFSPKEQSKFEAALKRFPASDGDARWSKVASVVGRTPNECRDRFQELIAFFQAKKQSQG